MKISTWPTFLVIGAVKGGTTSLYHYLNQHPEVLMADPKEPHFFDYHHGNGFRQYQKNRYQRTGAEKAIGEATPVYLSLPFVVPRIKAHLPKVKLIAILRDPVERAYSHWWMFHSRGKDKLSFEDAVAENFLKLERKKTFDGEAGEQRWRETIESIWGWDTPIVHRNYIEDGYYAEQISRYLDLFEEHLLKVVFMEDLVANPQIVIDEICKFIGVSTSVGGIDFQPQNVGLKGPLVPLARAVRKLNMQKIVGMVPYRLNTLLKRTLSSGSQRPQIDEAMERFLRGHYKAHNMALAQLVDRDLNSWYP